jgi:hypothetical protein
MLTAERLVAGAIVVLVALLARLRQGSRRRSEPQGSITEAQARKNAAPLTQHGFADLPSSDWATSAPSPVADAGPPIEITPRKPHRDDVSSGLPAPLM